MKRPSFLAVKLTQVLCVAYILILTFSYAPLGLRDRTTGNIIDGSSTTNTKNGVILVNGSYRPVVAQGMFEMICLGISRVSAFSLYPVMVLAFFSKCKATLNYLEKTPISLFMVKSKYLFCNVHACKNASYAYFSNIHIFISLPPTFCQTSTSYTHTVVVLLQLMFGSTRFFTYSDGDTRATSSCYGHVPPVFQVSWPLWSLPSLQSLCYSSRQGFRMRCAKVYTISSTHLL